MKIVGNVEIKGYMTIADLDVGDVFAFLDDDSPMMYGGNDSDEFIIDLETGNVIETDYDNNRPIRKIKASLVVED